MTRLLLFGMISHFKMNRCTLHETLTKQKSIHLFFFLLQKTRTNSSYNSAAIHAIVCFYILYRAHKRSSFCRGKPGTWHDINSPASISPASPGTQVLIGAIRSFPAGSMSAQISDCFPDARQLICDSTLIGYWTAQAFREQGRISSYWQSNPHNFLITIH